ncbi:hypothetical protein EUGRSUZ_J02531 [Eucalyptus grandis]|uniref:Uncharacterized protein n=2 Tax=Eucalyptus grandis TaxID=71139 RepID=A0ACC3J8W5_EUCGR|nr:hypothetical protein EUGRSUZ_J02531 [Eucalyptus grandis]
MKAAAAVQSWKLCGFLRKCLFKALSVGSIPSHVAFIMDGNRRYAKRKNLVEGDGHWAGFSSLITILGYGYDLGIRYVTVYAFSIDNFKRWPDEVQGLMDLMVEKIEELLKTGSFLDQYGIRIYFIGNLRLLNGNVRIAAEKAMKATASNNKTVLLICVAYASRDEIVNAIKRSCEDKLDEADAFEGNEDIKGMNVIRSSGETRLSNFLLWQTAYCPLYAPDALWPDMGLWHLVWAVLSFQRSYSYLQKKKHL